MSPARRSLLLGALIAVVGAVLILVWVQRGNDTASDAAGASTSRSTETPTATPTSTSPTDAGTGTATADATGASPATAEPPPSPESNLSTGATLRIPGIDLRVGLHAEGLRDGKINPPAGTVMWFTGYDRVSPGAVGTSVIAGHVVAGGRPDTFADLAQVRVGDRVEIAGEDGTTSTFKVVRAGVVDKDDLTRDQTVWGPNSSVRRLAIVTCDDAYGFRGDGHRVANYVVIAEQA